MALDLWTHQFCLACDKQVQSDGAAYCSESCRLADHEWTSTTPSSQASSPGMTPPCNGYPWSTSTMALTASTLPSTRNSFQLPPPIDFGSHSRGKPTHSYPSRVGLYLGDSSALDASASNLTPSSSHSSLCSMQSTTSSVDSAQLSDKSRQELKAYAISFEQVRIQRRRSY
ncbi:life-span regulatory factor domain-containing protein [Hirsutella rhossiliensis]|uniref:Life-span regulatory factor domain-containing protein n=1 Tax=Hirsutella rhossiliensis TaxID=111463 RepID=A0A9P8MTH5_9HYPO|nr:life-span regulatory factor domain-containing protein [Hirsutella rhossiliensis]KAH0960879.1 life-span regulatory factor domain-containing protein [Hirsutella rhossiliensis]